MTKDNIPEILQLQREFFASHATKDVSFRLKNLKKLKKAIKKYEEPLYDALFEELHKSKFESYATEIGFVLDEIGTTIKHLKDWAKVEKVDTPLVHFKAESYIYAEPYGQALIIAPWNYPFQLLIAPLAGAIAAGNTAILKPSEYTPKTAAVMEKMLSEIFPPEYVATFQGKKEVSQALLKEKFDYIFFTGSTQVGRIVMKAAAEHLTPVTLELGGKSPCVVHKDANLDLAAKRIVWGKFINAGQTCVAPDYLYIHKDIKDKFLKMLQEIIRRYFTDNPKQSPDYPRVVNEQNMRRLLALIEGADVYCGGQHDMEQRYLAPTILNNVQPIDPVMQEEIFGPVFPVMEYADFSEAIDYINANPKPLALYIFSESKKRQKEILLKTSSGGGCINETVMHLASPYLPFGGVGQSGMGAYHGKSSFDTFSHKKSVMKKSNLVDVPLRYPPYNDINLALLKRTLK